MMSDLALGDNVMFQLWPGTWATGKVYAFKGKNEVVLQYNGEFHTRPVNELKTHA